MTRSNSTLLLEELIGLLVRRYGENKVRAALFKASKFEHPVARKTAKSAARSPKRANGTIKLELDKLRAVDWERYRILSNFYDSLSKRDILRESQDIRQFAQIVGAKEIVGKSRKDLTAKLMRFLLEIPTSQLSQNLEGARNISEHQRQRGFSLLTDKLLGER